jgi:hypothetical protein
MGGKKSGFWAECAGGVVQGGLEGVAQVAVSCLIAEFYLVDRGLRHRLPGFSSMGRLVILP